MGAPDPQQLLTALTTEHFTLQGARSQTMSETSARASVYMYSVSSVLVALGFVSQVADGVGVVFNVFALTVLPAIYFLGCTTYVRLVECSAEDLRYGMAINRIRGYYKELAADRADLFLLSGHDDAAGVFENMGLSPHRRSPAFAFSTAVAVVNGVVGGGLAAVALGAFPDVPLWLAVAAGVLVAAASIAGWLRYAAGILSSAAAQVTPLLPTPTQPPSPSPDGLR
jgi:hypothetical protein